MMLVHNSDKVKLVCRVKADRQLDTEIFWRRDGARLAETRGKIRIRQKRTKSVLTLARVEAGDSGEYSCVARNSRGEDTKMTRVKIQSRSTTTTPSTTSTTTTTTTTTTAASTARPSVRRLVMGAEVEGSSCPISGYCLNGGRCSYIPWLGEMSCACAPGYQGARCAMKTTSALYSASFTPPSNTLCLFGIINPYHSCK